MNIDTLRENLDAARTRVRRDRWHRYEVKVGGEWRRMAGVTSVIDCLNKPALVSWSARIQQEADIETAWRLFCNEDNHVAAMAREDFAARFRDLAGKEKEHQKQLKAAGELGTDLHLLIENWCRTKMGETVKPPTIKIEKAFYVYAGFEAWAKSVDLLPIAIEAPVYSLTHGYAGTLDCLGLVNGELTLLDWKSSPRIYPEMRLQNIAYRTALEEMTGAKAEGLLVRLPKAGEDDDLNVEPVPIEDDVNATFDIFRALVPVYGWVKAQEKAARA